jgi:hypothetical protein
MDLDFSMIKSFPDAFGIKEEDKTLPAKSTIKAVLGKSQENASEYDDDEQKLFHSYHKLFKLGSKPAAHLNALSELNNIKLRANTPSSLKNLAKTVLEMLLELPE